MSSYYYLNPADYLDGPLPWCYIEGDSGPEGDEAYRDRADAIAAALDLSAQYSDVYRVHETVNGNDSKVVALVLSGVVFTPAKERRP